MKMFAHEQTHTPEYTPDNEPAAQRGRQPCFKAAVVCGKQLFLFELFEHFHMDTEAQLELDMK